MAAYQNRSRGEYVLAILVRDAVTVELALPMLRRAIVRHYASILGSGHAAAEVRGRWPNAFGTASD
jgi:hypothetical protein